MLNRLYKWYVCLLLFAALSGVRETLADDGTNDLVPTPTCLSRAALVNVLSNAPRNMKVSFTGQMYRSGEVGMELWVSPNDSADWALVAIGLPNTACLISSGIHFHSVKVGVLPQDMQ